MKLKTLASTMLIIHLASTPSNCAFAGATTLRTGLEKSIMHINHKFKGSKISIIGNKGKVGQGIIIIMTGETQTRIIAKKAQGRLGIWSVSSLIRFNEVPIFYQLLSNEPPNKTLPQSTLAHFEIGIKNIKLGAESKQPHQQVFEASQNMIQEAIRDGAFAEKTNKSIRTMDGGTLFKANFTIPSTIKEGRYAVTTILTDGHEIRSINIDPFYVEKVGISHKIAILAKSYRMLYFGLCLSISTIIGIIAFAITTIVRKKE
jgi:hypothetical protein